MAEIAGKKMCHNSNFNRFLSSGITATELIERLWSEMNGI